MKIGIIASFFETRTDIFPLIEQLRSDDHQVVLFTLPKDEALLKDFQTGRFETRIIHERKTGFWNFFWERLFLLGKKIPRSRNNYFLMELFKASNLQDAHSKKKAFRILQIQKWVPHVITYDLLLKMLSPSGDTDIEDIDLFIGFTECTDDYFYARLLQQRKSLHIYVYSWDHACKQTRFIRSGKYYTWNIGIKEDLIKLQFIDPANIYISGSSQFTFIHDHLKSIPEPTGRGNYIYFGCAIGIAGLIEKEVEIIQLLAQEMQRTQPDWMLVVRPYPNLKNWDYYSTLEKLPNVQMDNAYRNQNQTIKPGAIAKKYKSIRNAKAFIHTGSTLGLEACYFDVPVFVADLFPETDEELSIYHFVHQYQNDKYFNHPFPENIIDSVEKFRYLLTDINNPVYTKPNKEIPVTFPIMGMAAFVRTILN